MNSGAPRPPRLVAEKLGAKTGSFALEGIDLQLFGGQAVGLVGPSGSGKSTLARVLVGLEEATSGRLIWDDDHQRRIQLAWQDNLQAFDPQRSVAWSLAAARELCGLAPLPTAVYDSQLKQLGLHPQDLQRRPQELSGGQRQRAGLARALMAKPRVLIADEVTSALDSVHAWEIVDLLRDRRDRGLAILFITHQLELAAGLCDQLIVLDDGEIVERGTTAEMLEQPRHAVTQALLNAARTRARGLVCQTS